MGCKNMCNRGSLSILIMVLVIICISISNGEASIYSSYLYELTGTYVAQFDGDFEASGGKKQIVDFGEPITGIDSIRFEFQGTINAWPAVEDSTGNVYYDEINNNAGIGTPFDPFSGIPWGWGTSLKPNSYSLNSSTYSYDYFYEPDGRFYFSAINEYPDNDIDSGQVETHLVFYRYALSNFAYRLDPDNWEEILEDLIYGQAGQIYVNSARLTISTDSILTPDPFNLEVIPIPSAVWFLGSGLIGIVGIRRKINS